MPQQWPKDVVKKYKENWMPGYKVFVKKDLVQSVIDYCNLEMDDYEWEMAEGEDEYTFYFEHKHYAGDVMKVHPTCTRKTDWVTERIDGMNL